MYYACLDCQSGRFSDVNLFSLAVAEKQILSTFIQEAT